MQLSEQEIIRREKLAELTQLGIDAYPAAEFPITHSSIFIKENYKPLHWNQDKKVYTDSITNYFRLTNLIHHL